MLFLNIAFCLLFVVANVTIGKTNERFWAFFFVISKKLCIFAAQYR